MARWVGFLLLLLANLGFAQGNRVLRGGDIIELRVASNPSLCVIRKIDSQGLISLPGVGKVCLGGLNSENAAKEVCRVAGLSASDVEVLFRGSEGRSIRYEGAVKSTGELVFFEGIRLSDVVRAAAPTEAADLDGVIIESELGETSTVTFDPNSGRLSNNPRLRSGDRVIFPRFTGNSTINILGGVNKVGSVNYESGMTLASAIKANGGISPHGNQAEVRIVRRGADVGIFNLDKDGDTPLQRGDTVVVGLTTVRRFLTVVGEVKEGGLVPWKQGLTLKEAVQLAGGPLKEAGITGIRVQRLVGDKRFRRVLDLQLDGAFVLEANDIITVPPKILAKANTNQAPSNEPRRVVPPR
ncbi:MAG: SLBB domain-containing protein [Armatimonadetes bacterium]|nr:SLBB domain-containing protein [Armatimonadota bacterium]